MISPEWVLTSAFCVTEVGTYSVGLNVSDKTIQCNVTMFMITDMYKARAPCLHLSIYIDQIDAVGGDHDLLMPSLHEQIRGVDQIIM